MLQDFFRGILSLIYPAHCAVCRQPQGDKKDILCGPCQKALKPASVNAPLLDHIDYRLSALAYAPPLDHLIHQFKYDGQTQMRHIFLELMKPSLKFHQQHLSTVDLIIPIPLHPVRLRERGYNQAQLLAEIIAQKQNIPLASFALKRLHHRPSQTHLSLKERWTNQEGNFKMNDIVETRFYQNNIDEESALIPFKLKPPFLKKHINKTALQGQHILLVDDIVTSGATASHAAFAIKACKARYITLITLAQT